MASEKAMYWMAVGLLALVVGNHFVSKFSGTCVAARAQAAADRLTAKTDRLFAMADVMLGRTSTRFDHAQVVLAMSQARLASVQTNFAREEAVCARVQAVRARMMDREQVEQMAIPMAAPRPNVHIVISEPAAAISQDPI
jgi:hypothetical protein